MTAIQSQFGRRIFRLSLRVIKTPWLRIEVLVLTGAPRAVRYRRAAYLRGGARRLNYVADKTACLSKLTKSALWRLRAFNGAHVNQRDCVRDAPTAAVHAESFHQGIDRRQATGAPAHDWRRAHTAAGSASPAVGQPTVAVMFGQIPSTAASSTVRGSSTALSWRGP